MVILYELELMGMPMAVGSKLSNIFKMMFQEKRNFIYFESNYKNNVMKYSGPELCSL